ncbi:Acyl-coenzyme A thioesterase PaaI, contains HGG motif [Geoalkalibacter ferrihydriticus]|uniref:Acyl-coenzyme A thioesterase THEM4 n=2 Tax=Geoalkalibacter ferrihydriticus TaxID=392333 RepID=A0A0C2EAQ0_9BACT|nr:PaaI family thioesterase [Geoalkalibacter ferrihydriticus]KIH75623.1 thioesterase [Geoalkalibacter ferrihydriticus DSM 17813]SDL28512.1 Acyl-coenzyme A thioesterase PaaI, contains HGG motif [Geoalkalibacter ferrihydriticus]
MDSNPTPDFDTRQKPDWSPFDAPALVGKSLRFVSGDPHGKRFRLRYFRDGKNDLVALAWFGEETEGPPGHAHGGSMAAVLDEVLGLAAWAAGHPIVVGNLNIHFRKLLPLEVVTQVETEIVSVKGRKVLVRGRLTDGHDGLYAEADCLCIRIL